jgi:hypothetical protein
VSSLWRDEEAGYGFRERLRDRVARAVLIWVLPSLTVVGVAYLVATRS